MTVQRLLAIFVVLFLFLCSVQVATAAGEYQFVTKWGYRGFTDGLFKGPASIAVDGAGDVYVVDNGNHRVQKFDEAGNFITKWGQFGAGDGMFQYPHAIAIGHDGAVFVIDARGLVQTFTSTGTFVSKWESGAGNLSYPAEGLAVDRAGYVYVGDTYSDRVLKFTPTGSLVTSWGTYGWGDGQMVRPHDIAVGSDGTVFVLDTNNLRIQTFTTDGTYVSQWSTWDVGGNYQYLYGIAVDGTGNVYVTGDCEQVLKFTSTGTFVTTWGSRGTGDGQFEVPLGIAVSSTGTVYVADTQNHRIQAFSRQGVTPTLPESYRDDLIWGALGTGDGQFNDPCGVAVDHGGNVYVPDIGNHRVQKFASNGIYITQYGTSLVNWSPRAIAVDNADTAYITDDSTNLIHRLSSDGTLTRLQQELANMTARIQGIAVYNASALYVTDSGTNTVQRLDPNGTFVSLIGGHLGGSAPGQFMNPGGIAVDGTGNIYVADTGNGRVQRFGPNGTFESIFGGLGLPVFGPLTRPEGVAVDDANNVYVTDTGNNRVLKYDANGTPLAQIGGLEGTGSMGDGSAHGTGIGQFDRPMGVAIDRAGNVYVADSGNNRIHRFVREGATPAPTVPPVKLVPGGAGVPTNLDGDSLYEDVNGNGRKDFADVVLYFNQMTWIGSNEPVAAFDYNGNGRIDFADVTWLFNNL